MSQNDDIFEELYNHKQMNKEAFELVIEDPNKPENFLLGLECLQSYPPYFQSMRDRLIVKNTQLKSKGWKILPIYPEDWFVLDNRERLIEKIKSLV